jgi:hypothetical protein
MLNRRWFGFLLTAAVAALLFDMADLSVMVMLLLFGTLTLWLGFLRIAEQTAACAPHHRLRAAGRSGRCAGFDCGVLRVLRMKAAARAQAGRGRRSSSSWIGEYTPVFARRSPPRCTGSLRFHGESDACA